MMGAGGQRSMPTVYIGSGGQTIKLFAHPTHLGALKQLQLF